MPVGGGEETETVCWVRGDLGRQSSLRRTGAQDLVAIYCHPLIHTIRGGLVLSRPDPFASKGNSTTPRTTSQPARSAAHKPQKARRRRLGGRSTVARRVACAGATKLATNKTRLRCGGGRPAAGGAEQHAPPPSPRRACDNSGAQVGGSNPLGQPVLKISSCGACRDVRYCSDACNRAAWRSHKTACRKKQAEAAAAKAAGAKSASGHARDGCR